MTKTANMAAFGRAFVILAAMAASLSPAFSQETKKPESDPKALAIYQDAANFQNNKAFDLAIIEWEKFVKDFPKDPLADKAQLGQPLAGLHVEQGHAARLPAAAAADEEHAAVAAEANDERNAFGEGQHAGQFAAVGVVKDDLLLPADGDGGIL